MSFFRTLGESLKEEFYHSTTQPGIIYTEQKKGPASSLDLVRLFNSTTTHYWKTKTRLPVSRSKKKMLISDFDFQKLGYGAPKEKYALIAALLLEEFDVYVLSSADNLIQINQQKWAIDSHYAAVTFKNCQFARRDILEDKLLQKGENINHYYILDHFALQRILFLQANPQQEFQYKVELDLSEWSQQKDYILQNIPREKVKTLEVIFDYRKKDNGTPTEMAWVYEMQEEIFLQLDSLHLTGLTVLPDFSPLKKLRGLDLSHCKAMTSLSSLPPQLTELNLKDCINLTGQLSFPLGIEKLYLSNYQNAFLPDFSRYNALKELSLHRFPQTEFFSLPPSVEKLVLDSFANLTTITNLGHCQLKILHILSCRKLEKLLFLPTSIEELKIEFGLSLQELADLSVLVNLKRLKLVYCCLLPHLSDFPKSIQEVVLMKCEQLQRMPNLEQKHSLKALEISSLPNLTNISKLPASIENIKIYSCDKLQVMHDLSPCVKLQSFELERCDTVDFFPHLPAGIRTIYVGSSRRLRELPDFVQYKDLSELTLSRCDITDLPSLPSRIENLTLAYLDNLNTLPDLSIYKSLNTFKLLGCSISSLPLLPITLSNLTIVACPNLISLPDFSANMHLKSVEIAYCGNITTLPRLPQGLQSLIVDLKRITHLPDFSNFLEMTKISLGGHYIQLPPLPTGIQYLFIDNSGNAISLPSLAGYTQLNEIVMRGVNVIPRLPHAIRSLSVFDPCRILPNLLCYPKLKSIHHSNYSPIKAEDLAYHIDAETKSDPNKILSTQYAIYRASNNRLAKMKHSTYRHEIRDCVRWHDGKMVLKSSEIVEEKNAADKDIQFIEHFSKEKLLTLPTQAYFVKFPLANDIQWQPLPSLTVADKITTMVKPRNSVLRYNSQRNQYEIKLNSKVEGHFYDLNVQYIGIETEFSTISGDTIAAVSGLDRFFAENNSQESPAFTLLKKSIQHVKTASLQKRTLFCLHQLANYCSTFTDAPLQTHIQDHDPFFSILREAKGACRHRAFVYVIVCQYLGVPARLVENDIHVFAEVYNGASWQKQDLGGANTLIEEQEDDLFLDEPAELKSPVTSQWETYFTPTIQSNQLYSTVADFIRFLCQQTRVFLKVQSLSEGHGIYAAIAEVTKKAAHPLLYLESQWDVDEMNAELLQFIQTAGILVINWERFSALQMAAIKCLMDDPPSLFGMPLAKDLQIINIITPKTIGASVLTSRAKQLPWPTNLPRLIGRSYHESSSLTVKNELPAVDLYGLTDSWQKYLLGDACLTAEGLVFKPGDLVQALKTGKPGLILHDAPLQDPHFQCFIERLLTQRILTVQQEKIFVPPDFKLEFASPVQQTKQPHQLVVTQPHELKLDSTADIFYLTSQTLPALLQKNILNKDGTSMTVPGWLAKNAARQKILIQTEALSSGEQRFFYHTLQTLNSHEKIRYMDISHAEIPNLFLSTLYLAAFDNSGGFLIETADTNFLAHCLMRTGDIIIPIQQQVDAAELLETIECKRQISATEKRIQFQHQMLTVAEALLNEKRVILHGDLSQDLYEALESVFGLRAELTLFNTAEAQLVTGRLLIVTTPLRFSTSLAKYTQRQFKTTPEFLWTLYQSHLTKLKPDYSVTNFLNIRKFYQAGEKVQHGKVGTPPALRLNFQRILTFLDALSGGMPLPGDNPIKALFQHDYAKDSEEYAYLNVLAKVIFSQSKEGPACRKEKLAQYATTEATVWRRANCLNATALRMLLPASLEKSTIEATLQPDLINKLLSIKKNQDPHLKLCMRLSTLLQVKNNVVLKGPPGSGKSFLALQYAQQQGRRLFWGENTASAWLSSNPGEGEESVLILDEANLKSPGTWDNLINNPRRTARFKLIMTCNPENYPGRAYHPILQDIPTLYVNSWTAAELKKHIIWPLCMRHNAFDQVQHAPILDQLIAAYFLARRLLPPDSLSLRDLQQVTYRWLHYLKPGVQAEQLAYQAALREWGQSFCHAPAKKTFQTELAAIFKLFMEDKELDCPSLPALYLSTSRRVLLVQIAEEMSLAKAALSLRTADGASLVKAGVLLEGSSGVGKSTLLRELMLALKLKPYTTAQLFASTEVDLSQTFIQFTVSGDLELDSSLLLRAFHKGCKVIIDELNIDPGLEDLLNSLLTGKTPDNKPPYQSGFFVLASQNSATSAEIPMLSKALRNRLHVLYAQEDTEAELDEMVLQALPKLPLQDRKDLIGGYLNQKAKYPTAVNTRTFFKALKSLVDAPVSPISSPFISSPFEKGGLRGI